MTYKTSFQVEAEMGATTYSMTTFGMLPLSEMSLLGVEIKLTLCHYAVHLYAKCLHTE